MNQIIFFPEEFVDADHVLVRGERARYVAEWHNLTVGCTVKAGIYGGKRGSATLQSTSNDSYSFLVTGETDPLPKHDVHVIVAVPRPQTVKKVIQSCVSFGVSSLHFVASARVQPSYLQSTTLKESGIREEVVKALEQTGDTLPPRIAIHRNFQGFMEREVLSLGLGNVQRIVAHTDVAAPAALPEASSSAVIAVGPESGWTSEEVARFIGTGFYQVNLGERILRVEHALTALVSKMTIWSLEGR